MKRRFWALVPVLALCLTLSGCSDLLDRSYQVSAAHMDRPATAGDPSVLQATNYRELVSAVLYFVSQGEESGSIQLLDYPGNAEEALAAACLEVATEDPLGAYCVDYIRHELTRVVSYDQATLSIHYRRTMDQVDSMVRVTGTSAIRTELREALNAFAGEVVLRVAYFAGDADTIGSLIRQAYYDNPSAAFGFPQVEIAIYPETGRERVVEILLTYPESAEELQRKREELEEKLEQLPLPGLYNLSHYPEETALEMARTLLESTSYDPEGGATPYAALAEGQADSEGMALAYALYSREAGLTCEVVEGTRNGEPWFWDRVDLAGWEAQYLDLSEGAALLRTADELFDLGYRWSGGPVEEPAATEGENSPVSGENPE